MNRKHETENMTEKELHSRLESEIFAILEKRNVGKTCCPSEAARKVDPDKWRDLMPLTRDVAKELRGEGRLEICQKGKVVSCDTWTGPIRLRLPIPDEKINLNRPAHIDTCCKAETKESLDTANITAGDSPNISSGRESGVRGVKNSTKINTAERSVSKWESNSVMVDDNKGVCSVSAAGKRQSGRKRKHPD